MCLMFFGKYSYAMQYSEKKVLSFKSCECTDIHFCSKFMLAFDTRYQLWLEECMTASHQSRVNDSILNFRSIIEQACFGTFNLKLPSAFFWILPAGYVRNVTLPWVPKQSTQSHQVHTIPDYYKDMYVAPMYVIPHNLVKSASYAFSPAWHAIVIHT